MHCDKLVEASYLRAVKPPGRDKEDNGDGNGGQEAHAAAATRATPHVETHHAC